MIHYIDGIDMIVLIEVFRFLIKNQRANHSSNCGRTANRKGNEGVRKISPTVKMNSFTKLYFILALEIV